MDSQAPASFIPKQSLDSGSYYASSEGAFSSIFFIIALLVFIASIVLAGAAFGYSQVLTTSIATKTDSLKKAQDAFNPDTIAEMSRLDLRIQNAEGLLQKHVAPSALFTFLGSQTLQAVQFSSFDYELQADGSAQITLDGQADSFATVALQSDQFGANKLLKEVSFNNITVGSTGAVTFNVTATVDPSVINFAKTLGTSAASTDQSAAAPASDTTQSSTTTPTGATPQS